jgi:hypothetical protein
LSLDDPVLGGQIFVPRQQLLVHCPRYVGRNSWLRFVSAR